MNGTKEVHHSLDGGEGNDRHLDEEGEPFSHCAIPETGKLHARDIDTIDALMSLETSLGVDELGKVVTFAVAVFEAAEEVNGVEVGASCDNLLDIRIVEIHLCALDDLEREDSVLAFDPERTAARFAFILDHAADAERAVEELDSEISLVGSSGCFCLESLLNKIEGLGQRVVVALVDAAKDVVDLSFEIKALGSNYFLPN